QALARTIVPSAAVGIAQAGRVKSALGMGPSGAAVVVRRLPWPDVTSPGGILAPGTARRPRSWTGTQLPLCGAVRGREAYRPGCGEVRLGELPHPPGRS